MPQNPSKSGATRKGVGVCASNGRGRPNGNACLISCSPQQSSALVVRPQYLVFSTFYLYFFFLFLLLLFADHNPVANFASFCGLSAGLFLFYCVWTLFAFLFVLLSRHFWSHSGLYFTFCCYLFITQIFF